MKNIGREKHKMPNLNTVCIFCGGVGFIQEKRISKKKAYNDISLGELFLYGNIE